MKKLILCFAMLLTYQITPAFADQDTTEERLMFRYRAATEDELNLMRTGGINLKAAIIVQEILPGFPSTQSEFKPNDIVLMVNGQSAITLEALEKLVAQIEPADKIKLSYINFPQEGRTRGARGVPLFKLVKGGVQKTLYYTLAVIKSKLEDKPPVSTKPVDTSSPGTSTPTVSESIKNKLAFADQGTTEERLMFRYRAATEAELIQMRTDRGIHLKAAIIVTQILPGFLSTQSEFQPDHIVLMVNGQSAITPEALEKLVAQIEPADKIKLSYIDMTAVKQVPKRTNTTSKGGQGYGFELVKGGVQKTLYYTLAVSKSKLEDKPPVSTKPVDTSSPGTSTPTVSEPTNLPVAKVVGIKTEFDPFKALYSISSDSSLIKIQQCPEGLTTQLVSITQKTTVGFPTTTLFITSTNPEWKFPGKPESLTLTVIIDNKNRFEIKCFDKTSYLFKTGTCYENISFNLDKQQLQSFAAATKIKAQLASSEFEFPNEYPVHVKQFLEEIQKYVKARRRSQ